MVLSYRTIIALLTALLTLLSGVFDKTEQKITTPITTQVSTLSVKNDFSGKVKQMGLVELPVELQHQLKSKKGGSIKFWEAVSWCETNHKWNDGGYYSGGLGMAQSVWVNYGGKSA